MTRGGEGSEGGSPFTAREVSRDRGNFFAFAILASKIAARNDHVAGLNGSASGITAEQEDRRLAMRPCATSGGFLANDLIPV